MYWEFLKEKTTNEVLAAVSMRHRAALGNAKMCAKCDEGLEYFKALTLRYAACDAPEQIASLLKASDWVRDEVDVCSGDIPYDDCDVHDPVAALVEAAKAVVECTTYERSPPDYLRRMRPEALANLRLGDWSCSKAFAQAGVRHQLLRAFLSMVQAVVDRSSEV